MSTHTETKSPLRAWYLTHFRHMRIATVRCTPTLSLMGIMLYSKSWVLITG